MLLVDLKEMREYWKLKGEAGKHYIALCGKLT
jgi:hypothetical protein